MEKEKKTLKKNGTKDCILLTCYTHDFLYTYLHKYRLEISMNINTHTNINANVHTYIIHMFKYRSLNVKRHTYIVDVDEKVLLQLMYIGKNMNIKCIRLKGR